jgi:hypothetical protein
MSYQNKGLEGFSLPTRWEEKAPWMALTRLNPGPESRDRTSRLAGQVPSLALFKDMNLRNKEGLE